LAISLTTRPILPIDAAIPPNLRETRTRVAASLMPREERVLRMRFGIGMNTGHTLKEVGQQFSVTRDRIRMLQLAQRRRIGIVHVLKMSLERIAGLDAD
jgi:RNA polymerase primary sigma factor